MTENVHSGFQRSNNTPIGFLSGGGEMGKIIQEFDWAGTSVGQIHSWPQSLRTSLSIILKSKFPMVVLWGADYSFFYNDAYRPTLGNDNKHPHVLGKPASSIWSESWEAVRPMLEKVYHEGESLLMEDLLIPIFRNGRPEDVYWTFSYGPIVDESDSVGGVFITCLETTERVTKHKIFEENTRALGMAMEIAELGIFKVDLSTYTAEYSPQIMDFLGLSKQNLPLWEIFENLDPEDRTIVIHNIKKDIEGKGEGKHDLIFKVLHPSNKPTRYLRSIGQVIFSEGKPISLFGIIQDVSQQVLSKQLIEYREKTFRNLVMQAPVAIAVFRGNDFVADIVNDAFLPLVGKSREEFIRKPLFESLPEAREKIEPIALEVIRTGEPLVLNEFEITLYRRGKEEVCWFNFVWEPYIENDGEMDGFMVVVHEITDQVIARKKIEESEERYRTLIEESTVATGLFIGRDLQVRYANDILLGYWGKDKSVISKPFAEAVPELKGQPFLDYLDKVYTTGTSYEGIEEPAELLVNGKFQTFYFNFTYKALRNHEGNIYGIHHIALDVTGEVLAKCALKESKDRFQAAVEAIEGTLWTNSAKGEMEGEQPGWAAITGQNYEEYQGYGWSKAVHPDDAQATIDAWQNALVEQKMFVFEHRVRMKNGNWGHFSVRAIPTFNPDGSIREWVGVHTNITDQKHAGLALQESEARFRSLADKSPMFVYIVEPGAEVQMSYFNKTWLAYTGQGFDEAIGRAWDGIVHPDDVRQVLDIYVSAYQKQLPYTIPAVRLRRHDGEYRWHMFKGNPRFLDKGKFIGFVGVGMDIHEQKLALEQLELSNEQLIKINNDLDNFIYTASHDLKAPMSNIEGLLYALRSNLESKTNIGVDTEKLLGMMSQSVNRFKRTILDLTEISKAQKEIDDDIKKIKLDEIIEDVKLSIQDKINESNAIIEVDLADGNEVQFSRKNIKSIIYNVLSNAIKYSDPQRSPKISFRTETKEDFLILKIKDNGLGIPKASQEKVFTMFKRFHDHVEGSGIGLYIVKRIIDNAGGKIELKSEPGKGSTFRIYFRKKG